jgi:hypothetical protein
MIEKSVQTSPLENANTISKSYLSSPKQRLLIPPQSKIELKANLQCRKFEDILNKVFVNPDEVMVRSLEIQSFDHKLNQDVLIMHKSCYFLANQDTGIRAIERNIPSGKY